MRGKERMLPREIETVETDGQKDIEQLRAALNNAKAGKEWNILVYVFLVNSNSSIADFKKSIYRHNNNINIIIVIIYDC